MKILITGGTGLIGSAFISKYSDYQFTVLTRSIAASKTRVAASVTLIDSLDSLANLDNFDAVINLAGEAIIDKRWSEAQKARICLSRWQTTQKLVELFALSASPPKVFLSGSAIGAYGHRESEVLSEESAVKVADFPSLVCLDWENAASKAAPYTRVVLLRTGIVLSKRGGALAKMLLPFKCGLGGRIADGKHFMAWIHYQDHLRAMDFLLHNSTIAGAVNLVAPEPQTNAVFTKTLGQVLRRITVLPMPKFVLKALLGESSCLLLDSQKVKPQVLLDNGFQFSFPSLAEAIRHCLQPRDES